MAVLIHLVALNPVNVKFAETMLPALAIKSLNILVGQRLSLKR